MFDTPRSSGSAGPAGQAGRVLTWTGAVLLVVGVLLAGPSLAPRTTGRPHSAMPARTPVPSPVSTPTATAVPSLLPGAAPSPSPAGSTVEAAVPVPSPWPTLTPAGHPPTRIIIPSLGVDAAVVPTSWQVMDVGGTSQSVWVVPEAHLAGWHEGSASLGLPGNTVINGHNWPENAVFRHLYEIEPGERLTLYSGDMQFSYEISEVLLLPEAGQPLEVRQANARYIQPTDDERVTLVTCHPYGQLTYRLVVIALPVEPEGGEQ